MALETINSNRCRTGRIEAVKGSVFQMGIQEDRVAEIGSMEDCIIELRIAREGAVNGLPLKNCWMDPDG